MATPSAIPVTLHVRDEGKGPAVVLLHGLGGDHTVWQAQVPPLSQEFRVLAPDLRGHGRSSAPSGSTFSFAEMTADLEALLAERSISHAHLVGLSAGGFLALSFALRNSDRVRSQVLVATSSHCDAHTRAVEQSWVETRQKEGFDAYVLRLLKDLYYPDWAEAHLEIVEQVSRQQREQDPKAIVGWGAATAAFDLRGRLGRLKVPTLIVQGMDDRVMDASHARLLRQTIPGAELKLFAATGHMVPVERPEEVTQLVRDWVRRAEAAQPPGAPPSAP